MGRNRNRSFATKLVLDSVNLTPEVVKGAAHCRHLEILELRNYKPQNCKYLNAFIYLPRLKCLTVNVDDRNLHSSRPPVDGAIQPQAQKFRPLSQFHFKGGFSMLQTIANDLIRAPHLRSIQVELTKYPTSVTHTKSYQPSHNNLCFSISDLLRPFSIAPSAAVESVAISFNSNDKQANESLPRHAVSILSSFSNLRHLEISGIGMFALNDALSELTSLWPKIQTLHLPLADNCFQTAPKVGHSLTLSNLQRIAQSCPELVSFRAPIAIPEDLTLFTAKVLHHPLTSLSVGSRQPIRQPVDAVNKAKYFARCLCAMFPDLRNIYVHQNYNPDFWSEVKRLVELCNDVRGFDRIRALASSLKDGR
ncbi:hypothetical protein GALMADRAFT_1150823 [Galerina marginata CBS 339.88]|uniref:F-box domain-containing protein n=1 Tax=Galerina marginata (strain CBS 339.88) TaxID=685588 RepID=A0A067SI66_GALM3|nr:hypothetical protein GALMADRAFT_1150823 [Galerina marginata CBS 339.88]